MAEVQLESLSKTFGEVVALGTVDLHVPDRQLLVLLGPSGCGKTTALRIIAGLEDASSGTIRIGGRIVNRVAPKDRNVAMVFQDHALYPHWSVYNNLAFGLKLRRVPRPEREERVRRAAKLLEIEGLLQRKPAELSGGQRQRVALGRAIVRQPDVFLLDEPLSHLDAKLRDAMRTRLARLHQRLDTTMIYVTHDQVEAMTLGDRIAVMSPGRIEQTGPPAEIYEWPASRFVAESIGSPPMNFLEAGPVEREGALRMELPGVSLLAPARWRRCCRPHLGKTVWMGVRPEDVAAARPPAPSGDWAPLTATVSAVQRLGAETLVQLTRPALALTARFGPGAAPPRQQEITVYLNMDRARLFDRASGAALERAIPT